MRVVLGNFPFWVIFMTNKKTHAGWERGWVSGQGQHVNRVKAVTCSVTEYRVERNVMAELWAFPWLSWVTLRPPRSRVVARTAAVAGTLLGDARSMPRVVAAVLLSQNAVFPGRFPGEWAFSGLASAQQRGSSGRCRGSEAAVCCLRPGTAVAS